MKLTSMMFRSIFSSGWPFFSYMASRKKGSITRIIQIAAALTGTWGLRIKKSGMPIAAPLPKQIS